MFQKEQNLENSQKLFKGKGERGISLFKPLTTTAYQEGNFEYCHLSSKSISSPCGFFKGDLIVMEEAEPATVGRTGINRIKQTNNDNKTRRISSSADRARAYILQECLGVCKILSKREIQPKNKLSERKQLRGIGEEDGCGQPI